MRWYDYIREKYVIIGVSLFAVFFPGILMSVSTKEALLQSDSEYCTILLGVVFLSYFIWDYWRTKKYIRQLETLLKEESPEFVLSLPNANSRERKVYKELLLLEKKNADYQLQEFETAKTEEIEFMEAWVHEIKTPIAAVKLLIEHHIDHPTEELLFEIGDEVEKIEDMVQKTICYSQLNSFSKDCQLQNTNLKRIVNQCLKTEYVNVRNKGCKIEIESVDFEVLTDKKWLSFIVKQLLDNAVKYSNDGGTIRICGSNEDYKQKLIIEDQGIGIRQEDLRQIFHKGYTGKNGRCQENATGVGLYLSNKLALKLGHSIQIESKPGEGTRAIVIFAEK